MYITIVCAAANELQRPPLLLQYVSRPRFPPVADDLQVLRNSPMATLGDSQPTGEHASYRDPAHGDFVVRTSDLVEFHVDRARLAFASSVFADMFSIPQPQDASLMHGCPVVQLFDSAKDIAVMLSALYDTQ